MLRHIKKNKRANAFAWLMVIVASFMVIVIYIAMSEPFAMIYDKLVPGMNASYVPTAQRYRQVWYMFPLIMLVGLILWGYLQSMRREPESFQQM